jgi:hypothetical protein
MYYKYKKITIINDVFRMEKINNNIWQRIDIKPWLNFLHKYKLKEVQI